MAVAYRSGATVTNGTAGTSVTISKPAGMTETGAAGADVMVAFIASVGAPTFTAPAGWTLITSVASGSALTLKAYWKLANSEGASFTWTLGASQRNVGWIAAYTGAAPTAPVYDYSYDDALTSSTILVPGVPQDAVQTPYGLGIGVAAATRTASGVATSWTHSSTERVDLSTNAGAGTDISAVGGTAINSTLRATYTPTLTASQTQTGGVALAVTLKPYFVPYSGALNATGVVVEAAFGVDPDSDSTGWSWTNLTSYVLANSKLGMRHGRADRAAVADPSELSFTLFNPAGAFTKPTGLFRQTLGRSVPIRVRVTGFGYTTDLPLGHHRGTFFVSALRPRWDTSANVAVLDVIANGRLRRLQHAPESDVSAARAALSNAAASTGYVAPVAYWPFEDESGATVAASTSGNVAAAVTTSVTFADDLSAVGSAPLATLATSTIIAASVPTSTVSNKWRVVFTVQVPTEPAAATTLLTVAAQGGAVSWRIYVTPGTSAIAVDVTSSAGTVVVTGSVNVTEALFYGHAVMVTLLAQQSGNDIAFRLDAYWDQGAGLSPANVAVSGTATSLLLGRVTGLTVVGSAGLDGAGFGHLAVYDNDTLTPDDFATAVLVGNAGDWPWFRFERLANARGIPNYAAPSDSTILQMGPQPVGDLMTQLRECETVEGCVLNDSGVNGSETGLLWFPARDDRENIKASLTLDIDAGQVAPGFEPLLDDQNMVNDVVVSRSGGSSARVEDTDSIAVEGRYPLALTVNTDDDILLAQIAGLHVAAGTVKGFRFPAVRWDLRAAPELAEQWLTCLLFHRIDITHPPTQYPPDTISAILEGYTEVISPDTWMVQANLSPYLPNHVGIMAETSGDARTLVARMVGDSAAALRGNLTTSATSIPFDPNRARFTTTADDYTPNLRLRVAGETIDVSACATTAATFVATGTVAHANNASVTPTLPAGATTNDLLLIFAAIRNSGAGVPVAPTGYTRLAVFGDTDNCQLFAKVATSSESNPTVTFTGGVANADTTAQMIALRNMPITLTDLADVVVRSSAQLNASGQDIAYPQLIEMNQDGCVVLVLGWKQDDWTSVAALSGFTEIDEPDTTTGDDHGIVWDYVIQTTAAYIGAGSFTVTGGASAISRGAVVALAAGFQTFTAATRAVNGVSKSHTAGTLVEIDDPGVMGM